MGVRQARPRRRRTPCPRSTAATAATSSTRSSRRCRRPKRSSRATAARNGDDRRTTRSSPSRSSAAPTSASRRLFNRLVGEERAVVHDLPGTTRDSIDTVVETDDGPLRFVDTAGMRRRSRVDEPTEYYSVVRALQSVDRADACLFVLDATEGVTHQDQRLAERVDASGTAIVDRDQQVGPARRRAAGSAALQVAPRSRVPLLRAGAPDLGAHRAARCATCSRRCARPRRRTTAASRPGRSTGCSATPRPPTRRRSTGASAPGSSTRPRARPTRPRSPSSPTRPLPPTYLRYLERRLRESFDLGPTPIKLRVRRRTA